MTFPSFSRANRDLVQSEISPFFDILKVDFIAGKSVKSRCRSADLMPSTLSRSTYGSIFGYLSILMPSDVVILM